MKLVCGFLVLISISFLWAADFLGREGLHVLDPKRVRDCADQVPVGLLERSI